MKKRALKQALFSFFFVNKIEIQYIKNHKKTKQYRKIEFVTIVIFCINNNKNEYLY